MIFTSELQFKPVGRPVFQGVARFSGRNDMTQNQRACFIFYDITINLNSCVQEKNQAFSMSQRPMLSSIKISGDFP